MRPSPAPDQSVAPTLEDPVAAAASTVIGGPVGRHAVIGRGRGGWQAAAAALMGLSGLMVSLGVAERAHCLRAGWSTPDQFWHACYSDLPLVFQTSGLSTGALPYTGSGAPHLEQPVGSGLVMWLLASVVPTGTALSREQWYFGLWAVLVAVLVVLVVLLTAASVPRHPWKAAHVALSPVLVTASLVSVDLFGVALTAAGLWAWGRRRVPLAGVALGLAVATRTYPLVVIAAIGLVALRSGRLRQWAVLAGTALGTWLVVTLPWLLLGGDGVLASYRSWWQSRAGYGSPWLLPSLLGHDLPAGAVTGLAVVGWLAALVVGAILALGLERRPAVAEVAFIMVAVVVLTGKAVPVQAALWLLPLLALVGVRWRDHLLWAGAEVAYFVGVWLYLAAQSVRDRGLTPGAYGTLLVVRVAALLWLVVQVWRVASRRWPVGEGVEEPELDELAGPLAGAADRVLVRLG